MINLIISKEADLKVVGAEYENNGLAIYVEIKVCTVKDSNNKKNIGTILEKYRKKRTELGKQSANDYYNENEQYIDIDAFFDQRIKFFDNYRPDVVICFYPLDDDNRLNLLKKFKEKIEKNTKNITGVNSVDCSDKFLKKDPTKSIKNNLSDDDFELLIKKNDLLSEPPIRRLLLIDDVIDEGKTLHILLNKLYNNDLIDNTTEIKMACIYNNPKLDKSQQNQLQAILSRAQI